MRLRNQAEFLYSAITSRESASSRKRKFCHAKFLTAHFSPGDRVPRVFRNVFADGISHTVLRTNLKLPQYIIPVSAIIESFVDV